MVSDGRWRMVIVYTYIFYILQLASGTIDLFTFYIFTSWCIYSNPYLWLQRCMRLGIKVRYYLFWIQLDAVLFSQIDKAIKSTHRMAAPVLGFTNIVSGSSYVQGATFSQHKHVQ